MLPSTWIFNTQGNAYSQVAIAILSHSTNSNESMKQGNRNNNYNQINLTGGFYFSKVGKD